VAEWGASKGRAGSCDRDALLSLSESLSRLRGRVSSTKPCSHVLTTLARIYNPFNHFYFLLFTRPFSTSRGPI
jgi:hypothetical protein